MQKLTWSEIEVVGGEQIDTLLPQPAMELGYYKDVAILAFPSFRNGKPIGFSDWQLLNNSVFNHKGLIDIREYDKEQVIHPEDVIDLTKQVDSNGCLSWEAPSEIGRSFVWTYFYGKKELCGSGYRCGT